MIISPIQEQLVALRAPILLLCLIASAVIPPNSAVLEAPHVDVVVDSERVSGQHSEVGAVGVG